MRYLKTICFSTNVRFDSEKDDREVNNILQRLQDRGAEIRDITVRLAGGTGATALYVIEYEADAPIE
jgi:hypothetical protein